jgi:hypothetical protein
MKKVAVFLFLACIGVFSVNAAAPPIDTSIAAISPNLCDWGGWSASQFRSTIDTTGGFLVMNPDSSVAEVKVHVTTTASTGNIYPWVSIDCDLDSGKNFSGVTAIRITYKADKQWYMGLTDTLLDPDNSGPYQAKIPAATSFVTAYFNIFDTATAYDANVTFTQADWISGATYRVPINYSEINALTFSPNDDAGSGVESTIEISDLRLYGYTGFANPVTHNFKSLTHASGAISLAQTGILKFSVPQNSTYMVSLFSPAGKLMMNVSKVCSKDNSNEISLKSLNLAPGIYIAKISQVDYSVIGKIIIK